MTATTPVDWASSDAGRIVLRLTGITKRFGKLVANNCIDITLHKGEILALLGENGAGKTTLMNILFGHYVADEGTIEVTGPSGLLIPLPPGSPQAALAAGIGMVHQHFTLADNLTVLENITLGTEPLWRPLCATQTAREKLLGLMRHSGLSVNLSARITSLSVGEQQRVEILKALYRNAKVLILDEPTAVLTPQETERLFETLRALAQTGLSIVFISHKLAEVMVISERVVVLRAGKVAAETKTAETMIGRPLPVVTRERQRPGEPVLTLQDVVVPGKGGRAGLDKVNLTVHQHEIVGIAGVAGNGQGNLFELLAGIQEAQKGDLLLFGKGISTSSPHSMVAAGVGRIPEDRHREGSVGDMSIWENLLLETYRQRRFHHLGFLRQESAKQWAKEVIAGYNVSCPGPETPIRLLSGGNIQKLILGRVLEQHPGLILANQPSRGLDVGAVVYVHQRLLEARSSGAGVLLFTEDLDELLALSDRVTVMYQGRLSPAVPSESVTLRSLGLMMAGTSFDEAQAHAA
jgi:simple sugar transport system ATP-binding protein